MLGDILDRIKEEFEYFISFEWVSDTWEVVSGIFDEPFEFSYMGVLYGIIMVGIIFLFRKKVFIFFNNTDPVLRIFIYIFFYIVTFIVGYLLGKRIWES